MFYFLKREDTVWRNQYAPVCACAPPRIFPHPSTFKLFISFYKIQCENYAIVIQLNVIIILSFIRNNVTDAQTC